jgi:hypothetical protein
MAPLSRDGIVTAIMVVGLGMVFIGGAIVGAILAPFVKERWNGR